MSEHDSRNAVEAIDVSVVLAVFDEADHLQTEIDRIVDGLGRSSYRWELIIVDDGSTDGSSDIARRAAQNHDQIRLLHSASNRGAGYARRIGTKAARGTFVVWTDADLTYPNDEIAELVDQLGDDHDQVVGARNREHGSFLWLRIPVKWGIRMLAAFLTQTKIPDLNSGFRAFRRDIAQHYLPHLPSGFSCVTTITLTFLMDGYRIRYVPVPYEPRAGQSKFHWRKDTYRYALQVVRIMLSYDPLRVLATPILVVGALFAAKLGYDLIDKDLRPAASTLLIGLALFQLVAVGLIADLIVRRNRTQPPHSPADVREEMPPRPSSHPES